MTINQKLIPTIQQGSARTVIRRTGKLVVPVQTQNASGMANALIASSALTTHGMTNAASLIRTTGKSLISSHGQLASLIRSIKKIINSLQGEALTLIRSIQKIINVVQVQVVTLIRAIAHIITLVQAQAAMLIRAIQKIVNMVQA